MSAIRVSSAELVGMLTDLSMTAADPDLGAIGGVLLHSDSGYLGIQPGRTTLLAGTSTNRFAVGHTWAHCAGSLPPMLWPIEAVGDVVAVLRPRVRDNKEHAVEIRVEGEQVVLGEDPDLFGSGFKLEFDLGNVADYPRNVWQLLGDVPLRPVVLDDNREVPGELRTDFNPKLLAPFAKIAVRRAAPLELYRYHQFSPVLVQIGPTYRGVISPVRWEGDGSAPSADVYVPTLPDPDLPPAA